MKFNILKLLKFKKKKSKKQLHEEFLIEEYNKGNIIKIKNIEALTN
jgi:hypothetical protein